MSKAAKSKIDDDIADAIEHVVQKCVDERMEDVEDEIAKKVVSILNQQEDSGETTDQDNMFNPLGGP